MKPVRFLVTFTALVAIPFAAAGFGIGQACAPEVAPATPAADIDPLVIGDYFTAPALTGRGHIAVVDGAALISVEHRAMPIEGTLGEALYPDGILSSTLLRRPVAGLKASLESGACVLADSRRPGFPAYSPTAPCDPE